MGATSYVTMLVLVAGRCLPTRRADNIPMARRLAGSSAAVGGGDSIGKRLGRQP